MICVTRPAALLALLLVAASACSGAGRGPAPVTPSPTAAAPPIPEPVAIPSPRGAGPHILVVIEENVGYQLTLGSCGRGSPDPYLCSLAARYASASAWYGVTHPSLPNYLDLVSGGDQGCSDDGCQGPYAAPSLGGQLARAGVPWAAYMESMPSACFRGAVAGSYARKHNPFVLFTDVAGSSLCAGSVLPFPGTAALAGVLDSANAPDFVWITPNGEDDMHDGTIQQADAWLQATIGPVLGTRWFSQAGTVIVTMDENDSGDHGGCCGGAQGGRVPLVVISAKSRGRGQVDLTGDHFGTLRTIETAYGLPLLGKAAAAAAGDFSDLIG